MARAEDKDSTSEHEQPPEADGRPGHVVVDSRGRNVWRWARDVIDSTSVLLKRLENKDLALEPTQKVPVIRPGQQPQQQSQLQGKTKVPSGAKAPSGAKGREPLPKGGGRADFGLADTPRDKGGGFDPYNTR